jgi:hypothetical protein
MSSTDLQIMSTGGGAQKTGLQKCSSPVLYETYDDNGDSFSYWLAGGYVNREILPDSLYSADEIQSMVIEACTSCRAKVRAGESEGWESIATYKQTLELLRNPLAGVKQLLTNFRSPKGTGSVKTAADEYLKLRYGIMPLVNDIQNVIKALKADRTSDLHTTRTKVSHDRTSVRSLNLTADVYTTPVQAVTTHSVEIRAVSVDQYRSTVASDLGLSIDQIPITGWKLIPLSFVGDWFWNIGDYLNALVPRLDLIHKGACYTVTQSRITQFSPSGPSVATVSPWKITRSLSGSVVTSLRTKDRYPGLVSPALQVKTDFKLDKWYRQGDAIALIYQRLYALAKEEQKIRSSISPSRKTLGSSSYSKHKSLHLDWF